MYSYLLSNIHIYTLAQAMPESLTSLGLAELLWSDPNNFKIIKNKGQSGGGKGEETGESEETDTPPSTGEPVLAVMATRPPIQ